METQYGAAYDSRADYTGEQTKKAGAIEDLDRELERFDNSLERLERLLAPVSSQYLSEKALGEPHPEPATQMRGRIERLQGQLARLDRLMNDVDL